MTIWQQLGVNPADYGYDDDDDLGHVCDNCDTALPLKPTEEYMERVGVKTWETVHDSDDNPHCVPAEFDYEPRPVWKCPDCGKENY